jgi:hypothetical protein
MRSLVSFPDPGGITPKMVSSGFALSAVSFQQSAKALVATSGELEAEG